MTDLTKEEAYLAVLACGELLTQQMQRTPKFFKAEDFREANNILRLTQDPSTVHGHEATKSLLSAMKKLAAVLAS